MPAPDVSAVQTYLASIGLQRPEDDVAAALAAEAAAQRRVCKASSIEAFDQDLAEALCRRVARNLAMRALTTGVQSDEMGSTRIGSNDPEVRRLEAPHRKVITA